MAEHDPEDQALHRLTADEWALVCDHRQCCPAHKELLSAYASELRDSCSCRPANVIPFRTIRIRRVLSTIAVMVLTAELGGCAYSPRELQESGARADFTSADSPAKAAACLVRNIEEYKPAPCTGFQPHARPGVNAGAMEVTVPNAAYAVISPDGTGARGTIWTSRHFCGSGGFAAAAVKGC